MVRWKEYLSVVGVLLALEASAQEFPAAKLASWLNEDTAVLELVSFDRFEVETPPGKEATWEVVQAGKQDDQFIVWRSNGRSGSFRMSVSVPDLGSGYVPIQGADPKTGRCVIPAGANGDPCVLVELPARHIRSGTTVGFVNDSVRAPALSHKLTVFAFSKSALTKARARFCALEEERRARINTCLIGEPLKPTYFEWPSSLEYPMPIDRGNPFQYRIIREGGRDLLAAETSTIWSDDGRFGYSAGALVGEGTIGGSIRLHWRSK